MVSRHRRWVVFIRVFFILLRFCVCAELTLVPLNAQPPLSHSTPFTTTTNHHQNTVPYSEKIDIWSLACILFELWADGQVLFANHSTQSMLARISGVCGPFPKWMLVKGKNVSQWFTSAGWIFETQDDRQAEHDRQAEEEGEGDGREAESMYFLRPKRTTLEHRLRVTGRGSNRGDDWGGASGEAFLDFLTQCLEIDPRKRLGTAEALEHPFSTGGGPRP